MRVFSYVKGKFMLIFLFYIVAIIVLVLFAEGAEYLVWVMFFMILCWVPGGGDTVTDRNRGMGIAYKYKNCKEYNNSNPLYVRGCLRQKKKISILGNLKYLYICQVVSLAVLVFACVYYGLKICYGRKILVEIVLLACSFIITLVWNGIKLYYKKCFDSSFRYMENAEGIWQPFRFLYQPDIGYRNKEKLTCHYNIGYEDMKKKLELAAGEKGYVISKCYKIEEVEEFTFFARLNEETVDIFELIHIEQLNEKSWDVFNQIFESFWKETITSGDEKKRWHLLFYFVWMNIAKN